ncbi:hypothetical protein [Dechloromonas sp. A34]|uniref:Ppx/GppA phosphatase family protein n=1 Tax=Dechloromonas sp. A34 TaxID=447588 RepID=UPI0022494F72|nr:hypothetical protein [Dechloromonas sp. A34]
MRAASSLRLVLAGLFALLATAAGADESCRIAFDMGSSGIRAGASASVTTTQADIDFLGPLWAGRGLEETVAPTIDALRELPNKAGFSDICARIGGGFSAWRLAAEQDPEALAAILDRIQAASGTAVLVIPQLQEGAYGYFGARQLLGERLTTSHVLDIGGGSLQVAGAQTSYGEALGQKIWHRHLCQEIRNSESVPCALQPLTGDELAIARTLVAEKLGGVAATLPGPVTMTAISRPVSRGVLPAVARLVPAGATADSVQRSAVATAINQLAGATLSETMQLLGNTSRHVAFLLSDLLLVEGLLQATDAETLQVTELDLTNLPGLLADDRAYDWRRRYGCYLDRLRSLGSAAYASDPASCP